jgi:CubicO group peptidase (beta-lactamase class C family)
LRRMIKKRLLMTVCTLILLGIIIAAISYTAQLIRIGTAYKAKMLCSEVFVAGRDPDAVMVDLAIDDLAPLQIIGASIDNMKKTVNASFHGFAESEVRYLGDIGCALSSSEAGATSLGVATPNNLNGSKHLGFRNKNGSVATQESGSAENSRLDAVLDEAFSEPDPEHLRRTRAVVVMHNGRLVAERYAADIGPDTPLLGWSMTKSVMNALVGILVKTERISLADPIPVDAWRGDARSRITFEHLLHMSSGLKFNEDMTNPLADVTHMLLWSRDMAAYAADKPLEAKPGSRWQYSSGSTNILSGALRRILGDEVYRRFPREALFDRLDMTGATLEMDASGTFVGSSFMYATARDWARFGLLYLQDGLWRCNRILPEGWVKYTCTCAPADTERAYGALFWRRIPKEYRDDRTDLPEDAFHAVGQEGQFVTIVPSYDTVIVRLGKTRYSKGWKHENFVMSVLTALREGP